MIQPSFFDFPNRLEDLSSCGDPLERLSATVDFEMFRSLLEKTLGLKKGGRPPYDAVLMFKILILQALYTLSDDQMEYQIKDRLSFMRFLGLDLSQSVPDAKTIWLYRERLTEKGMIHQLFKRFDEALRDQGYLAMGGQIVDATIIQAPRQRMKKDEKEQIKAGEIPQEWKEKPQKLRQKDRDARWMVKYSKARSDKEVNLGIPLFGYKNHISIDKRFGFIRGQEVTDASVYDGHMLTNILNKDNTASGVWGDTAYRNERNEAWMEKNGFRSQIHRKKPKGKLMPRHIQKGNGVKSKTRSKVEHVFATQKVGMAMFIRTIGIKRARVKIEIGNLVYNMKRLVFWESRKALAG